MKAKKLFDRKSITVRVACALLSLIIFVGTLPLSVLAADADPIQNTGTGGSNISDFDLMNNDVTPDGFSTTTNPYGYGIGVPFLMVEQNELMVLRTYTGGLKQNSYYEMDSADDIHNFARGQASPNDSFTASNYDLVQAVAFDPNGTGRKDHVAFVGLQKGKGYLWVVDTKASSGASGRVEIGVFDALYDGDNLAVNTHQTRSVLDIVAGDFNGDGKESIVIYTPQDLYNRVNKTTGAGLNQTDRGCVIQEWGYQPNGMKLTKAGEGYNLLMDQYVDRYAYGNGNAAHSRVDDENEAYNLRTKLGVSMTVNDFNQDGIDDIAVFSYCNSVPINDTTRDYYRHMVKIAYGAKNTSAIVNQAAAQTINFYNSANDGTRYELPVAGALTSGDLDGDGDIDLFLAGMLGKFSVYNRESKWQLDGYLDMDADYFYMGLMTNTGSGFTKTFGRSVSSNGWTYDGYFAADCVWQKLAVEAVAINGHAAKEYVFVNGSLYDCSAVTAETAPIKLTSGTYFDSGDDYADSNQLSRLSFNSIAVGNFDGNDAGREQLIFTYALGHSGTSGSHLVTGYLRGKDYNDKIVDGEITEFGVASSYEIHDGAYVDTDAPNHANYLVIAVDRDYDGILAKYRGPEYAYTDPDVKAVLQAAPYFSDISDSGNNETEYRLIESYELSQSSSNEVSFSVGYVGEFGADEGPKASIEAGYALDWTETFEKSLRTEYEASFSAQAYNSVVVYRIPVFIYCFDIQKTDGTWHNKTAMQTAIPQGPVYEQLSVDAYNEFVDVYNDYMAARNDSGTYHELYKIDTEANYLANNEGNPYGYYSNAGGWGALPGGKPISKAGTALGTNGGMNKVAWTEETAETHETTMSHGFYFSFTFTYGFPGQAHGFSTSLEYSHGKGRATTKGTAIGASCTVTDIDGPGLRSDGVPQSVIDAYGFNWALGQWTQHLSGEPDNKTTFVGFNLTNIKSPAPAVQDLRAEAINDTTIELTWTKPDAAGWPDVTGYYVYMLDDLGEYPASPTSEKLSPDATSYIVNGLESNTEYTFVVVTVRNVDNQEIRSTWSNQAVAVTSKNLYTVTTESNMPKGTVLSVKHLGNINIVSGDEIPEGSVVKITASPKTSAYAITSVEIIENGKDPFVLQPNENGNVIYNFILGNHTTIRVNVEKQNVSAQVGYTDRYYDGDTLIGSITATANGSAFASGSTATGDLEFTATPAEGYVLSGWDVAFGGQTTRILADESNKFTLETVTGSYIVTAVFVPEAINLLEALEEVRAKLQAAIDTKADADEVNDALEELHNAIDALEEAKDDYVSADETLKAELEAAIEKAKQEAISAAEALVNSAKLELQEAINKKADTSTLNEKVEELNNAIATAQTVAKEYADSQDKALKEALENAIATAKSDAIASAETLVNNAKTELETAINQKADTATLNEKVDALNAAITTAETVAKAYADSQDKALKEVLENAIATAKSDAIASAETLVNNAKTELETAINQKADTATLNKKVDALNAAITTAETVAKAYADSQDKALKEALEDTIATAKSDAVSAAQVLVDNAKAELQNAIDTKADEATVNAAIANLQNAISKLESAKDNYVSADAALKAELEAAIEEAKKEAIEASKGYIPHIGENGNWWIGDTDTGIQVAGKDGKDGADGKDGKDGLDGKDGKDGKDGINGTNGKDGADGKDGQNGSDGRGIENAAINEDGYLVLTMSDGSTINAGLVRDNSVAANAGVSEGESTTRTIATVAAVCSGISLLWNIISLVIVLIEKKKKIVNI